MASIIFGSHVALPGKLKNSMTSSKISNADTYVFEHDESLADPHLQLLDISFRLPLRFLIEPVQNLAHLNQAFCFQTTLYHLPRLDQSLLEIIDENTALFTTRAGAVYRVSIGVFGRCGGDHDLGADTSRRCKSAEEGLLSIWSIDKVWSWLVFSLATDCEVDEYFLKSLFELKDLVFGETDEEAVNLCVSKYNETARHLGCQK
ncbi:hypothetical protein HG530_002663 [Fusarium avenaceum]|nr:hypothetical protein HG530_002663 [Fusarium avenaceum]